MDHLNENGGFEEQGTFVYQALEKIHVRRLPKLDSNTETELCFEEGQLVSVDLILPSDEDCRNGPFLRLADGAGWLFEFKHAVCVMQRVRLFCSSIM